MNGATTPPAVRRVAAAAVGLGVVAASAGGLLLAMAPPVHDGADLNTAPALGVVYVVLGAVIISRRPRNAIGWILLSGLTMTLRSAALGYAAYGVERGWPVLGWAEWFAGLTETPTIHLLLGAGLLLFPDGAKQRWRRVLVGVAGVGTLLFWLAGALGSGGSRFPGVELPQPVGWAGADLLFVGVVGVFAGLLGGVVGVAVDARRARGAERQRYAWFLYGVVVTACGLSAIALGDGWVDRVGNLVAGVGVPCGLAVAIVRYRLYEIGRLVRRTVSYAIVSAALVGVYATIAFLPVAVLGAPDTPDVAIAGATLAAAAVARPLRGRVQAFVDRRFDRARYELQRTVETFAATLRDEVDLDELRDHLSATVTATVAPTHVSLWLREAPA